MFYKIDILILIIFYQSFNLYDYFNYKQYFRYPNIHKLNINKLKLYANLIIKLICGVHVVILMLLKFQ